MINTVFKRALSLSIFCHIAVFSLFSTSFKTVIPDFNYTTFYFFGKLFSAPLIASSSNIRPINTKSALFLKPDLPGINKIETSPLFMTQQYYRPMLMPGFVREKENLPDSFALDAVMPKRKAAEIIFYPVLPYDFSLYFNDRQVAHVELKFKVDTKDNSNYIRIKRHISSGNLEVDLLTLRYIERYLFIERLRFKPESWQTVKIDLSEKND